MKPIRIILAQKWTLLGMFAAWIAFEGSARTAIMYGIGLVLFLDLVDELTKKEDKND